MYPVTCFIKNFRDHECQSKTKKPIWNFTANPEKNALDFYSMIQTFDNKLN